MKYNHPGLESIECQFVGFTKDGLATIRFADRYDSGVVQKNVPLAMLSEEGDEVFLPIRITVQDTVAAVIVSKQDALYAKADESWADIWLMNDRQMKSPKEWFMTGVEFAATTRV